MVLAVRVLALAEDFSFEILEADHDDGDVVERLTVETVFEHALDGEAALLMDRLGRSEVRIRLPFVLVARLPDALGNVLVRHLVEDTVARENDEVVVLMNLKLPYFWLGFHDIHVSSSVS